MMHPSKGTVCKLEGPVALGLIAAGTAGSPPAKKSHASLNGFASRDQKRRKEPVALASLFHHAMRRQTGKVT